MEIFEAIKSRRSVRRFSQKPVEDKDIEIILDAVRHSPTWANMQCWRFIVVKNAKTKQVISELSSVEALLKPMGYKANPAKKGIAEAPVVIVACADPFQSGLLHNQPYYMTDVGIASQTLMLAAKGLDLGTVFVGIFDEEGIRNLLNIPSNLRVVGIFPIGYPTEEKKEIPMPPRKSLSEIVFYEKWGEKG